MNEQQAKTINQIQALVRSAGQNVLDALAEIKSIKEDHPVKTKVYQHDNGRQDIVMSHAHGMTVLGNVDPKTLPRWRKQTNRDGSESYISADAPELPGKGTRRHGLKPTRPKHGADRPRRHEPYNRSKAKRDFR